MTTFVRGGVKTPKDVFTQAFIKLNKCSIDEFTIEVNSDGYAARVHYQQKVYQIDPAEGLYDQVYNDISDPESASFMDLSILIEATSGIISSLEFFRRLVQHLNKETELPLLNTALNIVQFIGGDEDSFWNLLWPLDESGMLQGYVVVAAAQTVGIEVLAKRIFDLQVQNGVSIYNTQEDGIFEKVTLKHAGETEQVFYIYSVSTSTVFS
jgi:hypothetical protein